MGGVMPRREVPDYRAFHWGDPGDFDRKKMFVPSPHAGRIYLIGELVDLTYLARKGREMAEWNHRFEKKRPLLAYNTEGLLIVAGDYRVETRGIVG